LAPSLRGELAAQLTKNWPGLKLSIWQGVALRTLVKAVAHGMVLQNGACLSKMVVEMVEMNYIGGWFQRCFFVYHDLAK